MFKNVLRFILTAYIILIFMVTLIIVLPFFLCSKLLNRNRKNRIIFKLTKIWSFIFLRATGLYINKIHGSIPKSGRYIIVANHSSYLDPIIIYNVIPFHFKPLGKKEIQKFPLFGTLYAEIAFLVDRSSLISKAKSWLMMQQYILEGNSVFLYPEGGFNTSKNLLDEFKDGAFRLAIETNTPILPVLFPHADQRWSPSAWWHFSLGKNEAYILDEIQPENSIENIKENIQILKAKTRDKMLQQLEKLRQ
jgi:1-acyl-sn-glycerol-3-phosphate acyltransferase